MTCHKAPQRVKEKYELLLVPERNKRDENFGLLNNIEMNYMKEGAFLIYEAIEFFLLIHALITDYQCSGGCVVFFVDVVGFLLML